MRSRVILIAGLLWCHQRVRATTPQDSCEAGLASDTYGLYGHAEAVLRRLQCLVECSAITLLKLSVILEGRAHIFILPWVS